MVIQDKLCKTPKAQFSMVAAMPYDNLVVTWVEHVNTVTSKLRNKKCTDENGVEVEVKEKRGQAKQSFVVCLARLNDTCFDKFAAR